MINTVSRKWLLSTDNVYNKTLPIIQSNYRCIFLFALSNLTLWRAPCLHFSVTLCVDLQLISTASCNCSISKRWYEMHFLERNGIQTVDIVFTSWCCLTGLIRQICLMNFRMIVFVCVQPWWNWPTLALMVVKKRRLHMLWRDRSFNDFDATVYTSLLIWFKNNNRLFATRTKVLWWAQKKHTNHKFGSDLPSAIVVMQQIPFDVKYFQSKQVKEIEWLAPKSRKPNILIFKTVEIRRYQWKIF